MHSVAVTLEMPAGIVDGTVVTREFDEARCAVPVALLPLAQVKVTLLVERYSAPANVSV